MEAIEVSTEFAVSPKRLYEAWLDGSQHGAMTGAVASVEAWVGGQHTAWDGYIWGRILELEPYRRIVQTWRTSEFPLVSVDSRLEILLEPTALGTRLVLHHTQIPDGQGEMYRVGWDESYFQPMRAYFRVAEPMPMGVVREAPKVSAQKAPKKVSKRAKKVSKRPKKKVSKRPKKKVAKKVTKKVSKRPTKKVTKRVKKKVIKRSKRKPTKKVKRAVKRR